MARKQEEQVADGAAGQDLCGLEEACSTLGVSRSTMTRWLSEGRLKGLKVGRQWRFRRADLERFGQMSHPSAAAVSVTEFEDAIAKIGVPDLERLEIGTDPALLNYPNTEEEIAVDRLFLALLANAVNARASDVHIEVAQEGCLIRTRIDGVLHETVRLPRASHEALVTCAKYHADMPVDQGNIALDGIFRLRVMGETYHVRVSSVPAIYGASVVMRLLAQASEMPSLDRIGMRAEDQQRYMHWLRYPVGLVIVSGPTGCGKTTVIYSGLQQVAQPGIKTMTVEDPVEVVIPWMTQVPVNVKAGMTFGAALRSLLRQDPDVIMVGAINSQDVGELCLQAAISGHLVVSTLHTPSAADAVVRLVEIGLEPFMITQALLCVMGTRLARKVCPECAESDDLPFSVLSPIAERARAGGYTLPDNTEFIRGRGCEHCHGTGYRGRVGLHEVMEVNEEIDRLIIARASASEIEAAAVKSGMTTIVADGLRKAAQGITSVMEVARVTHTWDLGREGARV